MDYYHNPLALNYWEQFIKHKDQNKIIIKDP